MSPSRTSTAARTHARNTAAAQRNLAMARARKARADLVAWMNMPALAVPQRGTAK